MRFWDLRPEWVRPYPEWVFRPHFTDAKTFEEAWRKLVGTYLGIHVYNCQARLVLIRVKPDYTIEQEDIEGVPEPIEDLVVRCVEEQGGALNISGLYRPCLSLINTIKEYIEDDEEWYEDFWDRLYDTLKEKYGWGIKLKVMGDCFDLHNIYPTDLTSGSLTTRLVHKNGKRLVEAMVIVGPSVSVPFDEPTEDAVFVSDDVEELAKKVNDFALSVDRKIREKVMKARDADK